MISFRDFISEDRVTHGWTTKRKPDGYDWEVHRWEYGKDKKSLHSGKETTREKAVAKAREHFKKYDKPKKPKTTAKKKK